MQEVYSKIENLSIVGGTGAALGAIAEICALIKKPVVTKIFTGGWGNSAKNFCKAAFGKMTKLFAAVGFALLVVQISLLGGIMKV